MEGKYRTILRSNRGGINRAVALLLVLVVIMFIVAILIPVWKDLRYLSERLACEQAMKTAKDGLIIEFLREWDAESEKEAKQTLDEVMPGRTDICPAHGEVYLIRREDGIFETLCGRHSRDKKKRARLNASRALELLSEELKKERQLTPEEPEDLEIRLNGDPLTCQRVRVEQDIHRGTATTEGFEGIVAYYGVVGDGEFGAGELEDGEICYFLYADEDYCAIWHADDGWTGSAYRG